MCTRTHVHVRLVMRATGGNGWAAAEAGEERLRAHADQLATFDDVELVAIVALQHTQRS